MNGLTNAISSQMGRMFATAMVSYGISTVAFAGVDAGFDYLAGGSSKGGDKNAMLLSI